MPPPNWDEGAWDTGFWDQPSPPDPTPPLVKKKHRTPRHTMASNPTPDDDDLARALADRLADGCHEHEVPIGILHNTEAVIRAAIAGLATADTQLGLKKHAVSTAYDTLQAADAAGTVVINNCKLRLRQALGERWSSAWQPTGFPIGSTAVPDKSEIRFTLLDSLKNYFTAVPASENAGMGATAALCEAAWTVWSAARHGVSNAESALDAAFATHAAAADTLRKKIRGLINELDTLIAEDDPRWLAFGLNIPANPSAPEAIASLTAEARDGGKIHAVWPYSTRMNGTRLQKKVIGVDEDWVAAGTADGLEKTLTGFTPGQTVELRAIAYNDGGDAPPSPVASVLVT